MNLEEEKKLIEDAQKKPDSFALLYDRYYSLIYNYCLRRVGNVNRAEDLSSETFLKAFRNLPYYRWRNIPFSSWLYRIASNEINMYFRNKKYRPELSLELNIQHSDDKEEYDMAIDQQIQHLLLQLRKLDVKYQEVIMLRYFQKCNMKEISMITGKKEGTIKSLISRGLEKIRKEMKNATDSII